MDFPGTSNQGLVASVFQEIREHDMQSKADVWSVHVCKKKKKKKEIH